MSSTAGPRTLLLSALGWLAGLALLQQREQLPVALWPLLLGAAALLAAALRWRSLLLPPAVLLLAFAQGAWRAEARLVDALPEAWEARDLLLVGRVDSLPVATQGQGGAPGWRFEFLVERAHAGTSTADAPLPAVPHRVLLSLYGEPGAALPAPRAGERWQAQVRLKRPHGLMNPHGFDFELWMFEQNLRATGVLRGPPRVLAAPPSLSLDGWRQGLREALQRHVAEADRAGVLAALSLGDQNAIGRRDWALFRDVGVAHLLSVSGTHVTMFAWLAQMLAGIAWRRSSKLCLWLPAPRVALWAGVAAALAYALFSGWGVPAQRTVWMLASVALLRSIGLRWPWPLVLLVAAVIVTAVDPWAIVQPGFWLSFAAVGLLMASGAGQGERGWRAALKDGLRSQWVATLGLTPLGLIFFQQISVVGLAANLLAIPLVTFVIAPLSLLGALFAPAWDLAALGVGALMHYLRWLDGFAWAVWHLPVAPWWAMGSGLAGGLLLVLPLPWRLRLCGLALLVPMLWPAPPRPAPASFELLAADVGQGTAVLVRTANHALLFDAGPQYGPEADAGERVLVPLLRALGTMRLDRLVLSHRDIDHVGGAASLLQSLPVGDVLSSLEDGHPLLRAALPHRPCVDGQRWRWDGVDFQMLAPLAAQYDVARPKPNTMSCVLRVVDGAGHAAVLSGDIEAAQEQAMAARHADSLRAEVLIVPHHGSKTSSSEALLDTVKPGLAFVQAGYRNRFGHPALPVLARYQAHGIELRSSPDCGAWRWAAGGGGGSGGSGGSGTCQRDLARRYWQAQPTRIDGALVGPLQDDESPLP